MVAVPRWGVTQGLTAREQLAITSRSLLRGDSRGATRRLSHNKLTDELCVALQCALDRARLTGLQLAV